MYGSYINNKLKVTPGKWQVLWEGTIETDVDTTSSGEDLEYNIAVMSDENPDYEYNQKAITSAVNFFKSINPACLNKLQEALTYGIIQFAEDCDKNQAEEMEKVMPILNKIREILINDFGSEEF